MHQNQIQKLIPKTKKAFFYFIFNELLYYDYDLRKIIAFIDKYSQLNKENKKILDVGCGYGDKLLAIHQQGYNILGIDVNENIIKSNQAKGMNCLTTKEFSRTSEQFDIILMSHIIEHFPPSELKEFMDSYLDRLKKGGYLIIATPLMSPLFYEDFDHVKPYYPEGILMVFGDKYRDQVQYTSRNKLILKDIWFRKRHYLPQFIKSRYLDNKRSKFFKILIIFNTFLCRASFGLMGITDGWVGILQKSRTIS